MQPSLPYPRSVERFRPCAPRGCPIRSCPAPGTINDADDRTNEALDLLASGTDGLNEAIEEVSDDIAALRDNANDATADDVEALEASVDELEESISAVGGEFSGDNLTAVRDAIGEVSAAAQAVISTLSDC